jgi:sugar (pentulose or hexulose) kinase
LLAATAPAELCALAVDGTSGTLLAVDGDGAPLGPALMYNDPVDDPAIVAAVEAAAPATSAAHGPTSGLAKLIALQDTLGVVCVIHQADWISGRFSGRFDVSDENNALKTGYDPIARTWPSWISSTPARLSLLPKVLEPGSPIGTVGSAAAEAFGLRRDLVVVAGTTDGCASFLATGAADPGDAVTALGSTLTLKLLSDAPLFAPQYGLYSHRIGDVWLAGGASNTGGAVLAHYFSAEAIAALSAGIDASSESGLDYYPLLKPGERFPINDPRYAPRLEPRPADDARFLQGLLEGIAGIEALGYRRLAELGGPELRSIRSVGGGAKNPAFTAIRQRRHAVPFLPAASEEAAAGAARLALKGAKAAGLL